MVFDIATFLCAAAALNLGGLVVGGSGPQHERIFGALSFALQAPVFLFCGAYLAALLAIVAAWLVYSRKSQTPTAADPTPPPGKPIILLACLFTAAFCAAVAFTIFGMKDAPPGDAQASFSRPAVATAPEGESPAANGLEASPQPKPEAGDGDSSRLRMVLIFAAFAVGIALVGLACRRDLHGMTFAAALGIFGCAAGFAGAGRFVAPASGVGEIAANFLLLTGIGIIAINAMKPASEKPGVSEAERAEEKSE